MKVSAKYTNKNTGEATASSKSDAKSGSDEKSGALERTEYNGLIYFRDPLITNAWSLSLPPGYTSGASAVSTQYTN